MALIVVFLAFGVVIFLLIQVIRKDRARREQAVLKEEAFIASMRANPRGTALPASAEVTPVVPLPLGASLGSPLVRPLVPANHTAQALVSPIDLPIGPRPGEAPIADITPVLGQQGAVLAGPQPSAPLAAPRDGLCLVCQETVDVRSNDQSRWGVKVQEPDTDRLAWIHLQCLARRLKETQTLRETLVTLVGALDAALTGKAKEASPAGGAQSLKHALEKAQQVLSTPPLG